MFNIKMAELYDFIFSRTKLKIIIFKDQIFKYYFFLEKKTSFMHD